ncbi:ABC transporter permease [Arthrobacter sp. HY1533]|uniref:ABC transporter permease n=1 Tax=Arthrobacter sp. HY1533 TaxID=2970919 RepID=UPI0022BA098F|nr:ABC transporter permease [Arthrobacter sp. HY1533]
MTITQKKPEPALKAFVPFGEGPLGRLGRVLRTDSLAAVGIGLILLMVVLAVFGQWIAPFPEQGMGQTNISQRNLAPGALHWLGTDQLGRDVLSRIVMGARPALTVSLFVVAIAALIGVPLGAIAGYRGGWLDEVLMRITEVFQSFPPLLLAMVTVAVLGPSMTNAGIALAICWWPWYARLVRAEARSLRDRPFVEAARAMGVPTWKIIGQHILRNCSTPILVQATVDVGSVILAAGSLAFIGLGAQPPSPDWGLMVAEGRGMVLTSWWISTFPGLAIFLATLGFNLLGDALRDYFDPRQVKR